MSNLQQLKIEFFNSSVQAANHALQLSPLQSLRIEKNGKIIETDKREPGR